MARKADIKGLFYITHIENVPSILKNGILSHGRVESEKIPFTPIVSGPVIAICRRTRWRGVARLKALRSQQAAVCHGGDASCQSGSRGVVERVGRGCCHNLGAQAGGPGLLSRPRRAPVARLTWVGVGFG